MSRRSSGRKSTPLWSYVSTVLLLALFLLGFGAHLLWTGAWVLPRTYDRLARAGLPVNLVVDRCAPGLGGGHGLACDVSLTYAGAHHEWVYPYEVGQFAPYQPGETVPALLDPRHPDTVYTVRNVEDRWGAGLVSVNGFLGVGTELFGLAFAWLLWALWRRLRRPATVSTGADTSEA